MKYLKLIQRRQNLRIFTALLAVDGRSKLINTSEKLQRWREHFDEVYNVATEVVGSVLDSIPEVNPQKKMILVMRAYPVSPVRLRFRLQLVS